MRKKREESKEDQREVRLRVLKSKCLESFSTHGTGSTQVIRGKIEKEGERERGQRSVNCKSINQRKIEKDVGRRETDNINQRVGEGVVMQSSSLP